MAIRVPSWMEHNPESDLIKATWRINGVLHLPWRPTMPEWTGTTTYHRDADGLITNMLKLGI